MLILKIRLALRRILRSRSRSKRFGIRRTGGRICLLARTWLAVCTKPAQNRDTVHPFSLVPSRLSPPHSERSNGWFVARVLGICSLQESKGPCEGKRTWDNVPKRQGGRPIDLIAGVGSSCNGYLLDGPRFGHVRNEWGVEDPDPQHGVIRENRQTSEHGTQPGLMKKGRACARRWTAQTKLGPFYANWSYSLATGKC